MTHFYLTLPSNSSQLYFPDNTLTEYTTKLASTIELTDEWEVGLAEIMFPRSWYTIPRQGLKILVDCSHCVAEFETDPFRHKRDYNYIQIYLKGGYYNTMEELTQELNQAAIRAFDYTRIYVTTGDPIAPPVFDYVANAKQVRVTMISGMSIEFPPELVTVLGFSPEQNPIGNESTQTLTIRGEHSCDLQAGIHSLYVYCDVLQFTHVGNIKAPLLRVVDSGGEAGGVVTRYYERPRYIPLQKKNFDSIQIIIRDDLGEKIQFENGKVLLTLHFRRAKNKYLL